MTPRDPARRARSLAGVACLALAIVGPATAGPASMSVAPGATVDQSNPSRARPCRYSGWVADDAFGWSAAQTFTVGVTGSLTNVVVWLRMSDSATISVTIAPVGADGRPSVSTPLASTSLAATTNAAYTATEVSFATPARVEAGTQYAIVLANTTSWAWEADLGSSLVDPNGARCADGAYAGGRMWLSTSPLGADGDFFFQTYVVPARQVTVQKTGTGTGLVQSSTPAIDCGPTCSGRLLQGESLTLTATPDAGSTFSGWSGGPCQGSGPTCSFSVAGDASVTAEFNRKLVTLTVHKLGRGTVTSSPTGISCGGRCSQRFAPGPVTLIAKPLRGWRFARWQGGCRGPKPVCRLRLQRGTTVAAVFAQT
jgi:List-Bact-rpt repeat protein